jgi:sortase A
VASGRRRLTLLLTAVALAASAAAGGWALRPDARHTTGTPAAADRQASVRGVDEERPIPRDRAAGATTTAPPAIELPTPEPPPIDERAPTPVVVHGTVALPALSAEHPLYEGVTLTAIDRGPSHWPGTAMPGQAGNVVVAGHRVTHSRPFYDLDRLAVGDPLVFTMHDGTTWTYVLAATEIVGSDAMYIVDQTSEPTATLFACHPKGSAAQRIVAHFRLA